MRRDHKVIACYRYTLVGWWSRGLARCAGTAPIAMSRSKARTLTAVLLLYDCCMTSVTVRLSDEHVEWLRAGGRSLSEALRDAIERAMREESYRKAQEVLLRMPLGSGDDWGDVEDFMLRAAPNEG